jgi:predicted RNase H-like nuclease (RuvC/YqgF family)
VLKDGSVYREMESVPFYGVIRLILEYHADILAVDNLNEIVKSPREVAVLSKLIPSWCKIVEVAGSEQSLTEVARRFNIESAHLTPLQAARVSAYAALQGIGREVKLHVDRTYIAVSKGRTPSQGGSSSERFKRGIRACVLRVVKEIRELLERSGLDYDLLVKRSKGGLEKGLFVVYAPVERVREVVSPLRNRNVKVSLKPVVADSQLAEKSTSKLVILGVDPGSTIGVAVLDFKGKPLLVTSSKVPDRELVVKNVLKLGKPVIVAVDTSKPPEFVKKLASNLNAILYTPDYDIPVEEKQKILSEYSVLYSVEVPDSHARDALASAVKAYRSFKPLIEEVESKTRGLRDIVREKIIIEVLRGKSLVEALDEYFKQALSRSFKQEESTQDSTKTSKSSVDMSSIKKIQSRILELEGTVKKLEEEVKARDKIIEELRTELALLRKRDLGEECARRVQGLLLELDSLRKSLVEREAKISSLQERIVLIEDIVVRVIKGELIGAVKASGLSENACIHLPVYLDDIKRLTSSLLECVKRSKSALIVPPGSNIDWRSVRVPVIEANPLLELREYALFSPSVLSNLSSQWRIIEDYEVEEKRKKILEIIEEYQKSRRSQNKIT